MTNKNLDGRDTAPKDAAEIDGSAIFGYANDGTPIFSPLTGPKSFDLDALRNAVSKVKAARSDDPQPSS